MPQTAPFISFRVANPKDLQVIHSLIESAYRGDESRLGWTTEADYLTGNRIDDSTLLAKITDPDGAVLLATAAATTSENERSPTNTETQPPPATQPQKANELVLACCEVIRREEARSAYFGLFAVSPRRQGGGIGRAMLAHAEDYCLQRWAGVNRIYMRVIASRAELIAWYVRRGYQLREDQFQAFPVEELKKSGGVALVPPEELRFAVLEKDLGQFAERKVEATRGKAGTRVF
ncbi:acyl-CoA N-acyltransferase [Corynascus novoguineensis]|uniref:Acyl-CoA N-acyltransferase n=1 Tax=Corynascus novoguineensis TaxID=1126955 RepID=A0AAN7HJZ6_9PEZI|nr:acyl-CoA N-acyltransferase [Corynascus novoguineensis]